MVVTVHDLYMARHATEITPLRRTRKLRSVLKVCACSAHIVVPTNTIKAELAELLGDERKVTVIPHGLADAFGNYDGCGNDRGDSDGTRKPPHPYLLTFCGGRRKNLHNTVEAFRQLKLDVDGFRILIIGAPTLAERAAVGKRLPQACYSFSWGISDHQLARAYANAAVVCYPSLYEGFGFPVLEGMAAGRPVVTTYKGATAEVAGGYAELVVAESSESIASGIEAALDMKPYELDRARSHALRFSLDDSGRSLVDLYGDLTEL